MNPTPTDVIWVKQAIELARHAEEMGEVPVGAIVVLDNNVIGRGWNQPIGNSDPTAHAEIMAIREASTAVSNYRLLDTTIYVTLEPCIMCIGAILHARIKRLVFGAFDTRAGAVESVFKIPHADQLNHRIISLGGVLAEECGSLLRNFFSKRR